MNETTDQTVVGFYDYFPSRIGAAIFTALFGFMFFPGTYTTARYRARFMYILPFCCVLESVGYGTRYVSLHNPSIGWLLVSLLSILLAPIFLAVINYNTIGMIVESTGKKMGFIDPNQIKYWFFGSDFVGLIIQCIGGAQLGQAKTTAEFNKGSNILQAGLVVQIFFFTIFVYMMFMSAFHSDFNLYRREDLKKVYNLMFVTVGLIYLRNVYRLVEFSSSKNSYIHTHEWLYFFLESSVMFCVCLIFCLWPLGSLLPEEFLDSPQPSRAVKSVPSREDEEMGRSKEHIRRIELANMATEEEGEGSLNN